MSIYTDILKQYWGYPAFRSLQEEIIHSVADGKDTLGLMPTGGGKSVTFQVYSLSVPGVCIVITPLISLMKDQVENLQQRGIKAIAIHSQLNKRELDLAFNAVAWGDYKFMYISPERISSMHFQQRLMQLHVNLIAVDEAHCISQWGYDFRPSYLGIKSLRAALPDVPVLALTATATPTVVNDIQQQLCFPQPNVLQKSFYRDNLVYIVRNRDDKMEYLMRSVLNVKGSGVVYMRSRKKTKEIAEYLRSNGVSADYYHAGLSAKVRSQKQDDWMRGNTRIIVATNAFGMGIDKADVRFVIHLSPPDSLEAYFQEAGRAGRDGKLSYALLMASGTDQGVLKRKVADSYPPINFVRQVYNLMGSYLQIAIGTGQGMQRDFDVYDFCAMHKYSHTAVMNSLKILQSQGLIEFSQSSNISAKVHFRLNRDELYEFAIQNKKLEEFIKVLLRSGEGLFSVYVPINEEELASKANLSTKEVLQYLSYLSSLKLIYYIPKRVTPFVSYLRDRLAYEQVKISKENYQDRKEDYQKRVDASLYYAFDNTVCRSVKLLNYFGESQAKPCGMCDVCKEQGTRKATRPSKSQQMVQAIQSQLQQGAMHYQDLYDSIDASQPDLQQVLRQMLEHKLIKQLPNKQIALI